MALFLTFFLSCLCIWSLDPRKGDLGASLKLENSTVTLLSTLMSHKFLHSLTNSLREEGPPAMAEGQFLLTLVNAWNGPKGY